MWLLQHRISEEHDWKPLYSFGMTEFYPKDFGVMNYATSTRKGCIFTQKIIVARMLLDEDGGDIVGTVLLDGARFKRRIGSETEEVKICESDDERVDGLRDLFGIDLSEREVEGIKGTVTEL